MERAWEKIRAMVARNARHVRGKYRLGEMPAEEVLKQAAGELVELAAAHGEVSKLEELADLTGCLVHFAVKSGFTLQQVEDMLIHKLDLRFEPAGVLPPRWDDPNTPAADRSGV